MSKKSTGSSVATRTEREIAALRKMPDSEVDFSDIPLQDPNDPKWKSAFIGKFYRPIKKAAERKHP